MNKIQTIELLKLRGIIQLKTGEVVADAIKRSGGELTLEEMVIVNQKTMEFYIQKFQDLRKQLDLANNQIAKKYMRIIYLESLLDE